MVGVGWPYGEELGDSAMKNWCRAFVLLGCVFVIWMTGCDSQRSTITGTVTFKNGSPAADIQIAGGDGIGPEETASVYTDKMGHYVLPSEGFGYNYVIVIQDNRPIARYELEVKSDQPNILDITLPY
jgi:hypothetical protein